jgi:hypothetical protein
MGSVEGKERKRGEKEGLNHRFHGFHGLEEDLGLAGTRGMIHVELICGYGGKLFSLKSVKSV